MKNLNSRGLTVVSLACWLATIGLIVVIASPIAEKIRQDDQGKVIIRYSTDLVSDALTQYHLSTGKWPNRETWRDFQSYLRALPTNPYDGLTVSVSLGEAKRKSDLVWGSIRVIVLNDEKSCLVVGYGRNGEEIKRLTCPSL